MLSEFSLIDRFFARRASAPSLRHPDEAARPLGIGDDCALIAPPVGHQLAISTDMLVEGRHFFADVDPYALGHKALAVNLSDLAAMGAAPHAFTLALALPRADEAWLDAFSNGLLDLARRFDCALVGGDTTSGPLNICITVFGDVPGGAALRRDGAQAGDDLYVSGTLGDARAELGAIRGEWSAPDGACWRRALEYPEPRVELGQALRGIAHAALDISDGLAGDLMHIFKRSNMRALVDADAVPVSDALRTLPDAARRQCALAGGDDYELCFTAPVSARAALADIARRVDVPLTRIGTIEPIVSTDTPGAPGITWRDANGAPLSLTLQGFDHFHAD